MPPCRKYGGEDSFHFRPDRPQNDANTDAIRENPNKFHRPEVSGWREHGIAGSRFLVVLLKDPEAFVGRMGGIGPALRVNTAMYGSPIAISSSALAMGFREFSDLFAEYFRKYGLS